MEQINEARRLISGNSESGSPSSSCSETVWAQTQVVANYWLSGNDASVIAELDVSEWLHEPVTQATSRLTNVQRQTKGRGDAVHIIARGKGKGVGGVIGTVMRGLMMVVLEW